MYLNTCTKLAFEEENHHGCPFNRAYDVSSMASWSTQSRAGRRDHATGTRSSSAPYSALKGIIIGVIGYIGYIYVRLSIPGDNMLMNFMELDVSNDTDASE